MANLKNRLIMLESRIPSTQQNKLKFFTVTGRDKTEIIGFKCGELKILRVIGESFDDFKIRGEIFFIENNDDPRNRVCFAQSLYSDTEGVTIYGPKHSLKVGINLQYKNETNILS